MFSKILESEVKWCEQNKGSMPEEFRRGFIVGLKQADNLIRAAIIRSELQDGEIVDDDDLLDRAAQLLRAPVNQDTTEALIEEITRRAINLAQYSTVDQDMFRRFLRERLGRG